MSMLTEVKHWAVFCVVLCWALWQHARRKTNDKMAAVG